MKQFANILVFVIFYLQCINSETIQKSIYAYKGKILVKNVASDKLASIWTISGKLSVENLTDHITFKLDDVKTRIFNGNPEALNSINEKTIPDDSKIIQEPFVVYPGDKSGYNITHKPDEFIWSLNMKRSIASIFFLSTDIKTDSVLDEATIYGYCEVKYNISNDEGLTIWKTIDRRYCRQSPNLDVSNIRSKYSEPIKSETKRIYYYENPESLKKVESISITKYQSMTNVRSNQIIEQSQEFTQISNTTIFEPLSIADLTNTSSIIFDFSSDKTEKKNSNELIKYFMENYEKFKEYFETYPLINTNALVNNTVSKMYDALELMDKDTLLQFDENIKKIDDTLLQHMFVSYLPYLGTNESFNYIKDLVAQNEDLNDLLAIRILAILPGYYNDVNSELVQQMEVLMDMKKVANEYVKHAGILCFASIVSVAKYELSVEELAKYNEIYLKNFQDAKNHETKMVWLLGLINMANTLKNDDIFALISNVEESRHIRVLAAFGFKEHLIREASSEIYKNMWPIIKNNSEPLEVRVACIEILLNKPLSKDEFDNIINFYKNELLPSNEQHLSNYIYTSIKPLHNRIRFSQDLKEYATEIIHHLKPPKSSKAWSTGNYPMAYTDTETNFGMFYQASLIANPVTNVLNSAFLTVDSSALSLNFGKYSAYIKAEGIAEFLFSSYIMNDEAENIVPKLLELMRKNLYKFRQIDNIHVDIVIFCHERVVFSLHVDKDNIENYTTNPLFVELLSLMNDYTSLSFPVFEYSYRPSDLGTTLTVSTDIVDIASYKIQKFNDASSIYYRSTWYYTLSVGSINPLIDASISSFKYIGEEKRIHFPFKFNFKPMQFQWKHEKDALNLVEDHLIGTMIDKKEVLQEYCENCHHVSIIDDNNWFYYLVDKNRVWEKSGVIFNVTYTRPNSEQIALNSMEPKRTNSFADIINHHKSITSDNIGKPILLFIHYITYNRYVTNDLYRSNIRSTPIYSNFSTESILELTYKTKDNSNAINPIANNDVNISIALITRKQSDAEILIQGNLTFRFFSAPEFKNSDAQPLIYHKYNVDLILIREGESSLKLCLDRDVQYPSRRADKFSLGRVDDAKSITAIGLNDEDITLPCPANNQFYVTEIYSANDNQRAIMLASNEYKNCKKQSKGLNYTPPTVDCIASHEMISKYLSCSIYASNIIGPDDISPPETEHGIHLLDYVQLNDTYAKLSLNNKPTINRYFGNPNTFEKFFNTLDFQPFMATNPRVVAYDDDDVEWEFSSACYITPDRIRTFTGHTIKNYDENSVEDSVAFVECVNTTSAGMTIQKYGDKYIGFQLYSYNDTLTVSVPNGDGKLKILFNNEIITKAYKPEWLKFYFLDDDVIFLSIDVADIYFTGEYISVKVYSVYNKYICGLCAETKNN